MESAEALYGHNDWAWEWRIPWPGADPRRVRASRMTINGLANAKARRTRGGRCRAARAAGHDLCDTNNSTSTTLDATQTPEDGITGVALDPIKPM